MKRFLIFFIIATISSLTACNTADTPEAVVEIPTATEAPTETATLAPTVSTPTARPTATPIGVRPAATSAPTRPPVTSTPSPTPTPFIYIVKAYDTIFGIALEFNTTVEALVAANGLPSKDFIRIGQELIIPTTAEATAIAVKDNNPTTTTAATASTPVLSPTIPADTSQLSAETEPSTAEPIEAEPASPLAAPTAVTASNNPPPISRPPNINPQTGLPVDDQAQLQRRPLMVRVGNDPAARPQVGLNSADMVYEEITEWWVTRFTAIFLSETPTTVAPIRSARLINVQLVPQYQGALAHSGGSDAVRWEVSQAPIANLDEFYSPQPYFYRPNEGWQTRLAINTEAAREYMAANGLDAPVALHGFLFSDAIEEGEPAENIFIAYPRVTSFTQWRYDAASSQYLRFINDLPLVDYYDGQISADNVIIYFAEHQETDIVEDTNGATSIRIIVNGRGLAWFFRDGKLNKGYWETDGARTPYFAYEDGRPYPLKPGRTWVEVVPTYFTIGLNSADEAKAR
jgi:LysM repeat protein